MTRTILASAAFATSLIAAIAVADDAAQQADCTPQAGWQHTQPGQTLTLDCGDSTFIRYPVFAAPGYGGHPGHQPFVIGWEDTPEEAAKQSEPVIQDKGQ